MGTAEQIFLFDEAEVEAESVPQEVKTTEVISHKRREKRTRDEIMADVPVQEVLHETEATTCERCGGDMKVIGKEKLYEELHYEPAKLRRVVHYAVTYKCTECGTHPEIDDSLPDVEPCFIKHAPAPKPMMPGSFCTPELLASNVIHADETTVQVLDEPKRKATTKSRMWVFANGKIGEHSNIAIRKKRHIGNLSGRCMRS